MEEAIQTTFNEDSLEKMNDGADCIITNITEAEDGN